jgi:hypothetical protein
MPGQLVRRQAPKSELRQAPKLEVPLGRQPVQLQLLLLELQLLEQLELQLLEQLELQLLEQLAPLLAL